jgi:hypothetical protein
MFAVTFLGHQGWLCRTSRACVMIDPLLCERFGHCQVLQYRVWPPRVWTEAEIPPLDAVVLTHEHDDHFDIPSLAKLDRQIPIYLSSRSSSAARTIIGRMGFTVHALVPGAAVKWKDLELIPFAGDHINANCGDEWDALPFLVRHTGGDGSFFSMVDITLTQGHLDRVRAVQEAPGIIGWTNNALDWSHMTSYLPVRDEGTQDSFMKMGVGHKQISDSWGTPRAMLMCAGGFYFDGERAWMNRRIFCVDGPVVCSAMKQIYPKEHFLPTLPGQTFSMEGNQLKKIEPTAPFLATEPPEAWPARGHDSRLRAPDYAPATGRRALREGERAELESGLQTLAESMIGGELFRGLHTVQEDDAPGRKITFALLLRDEAHKGGWIYEYLPTACAFGPGAVRPRDVYLAGLECWAADLHAILCGELGPIALTFGRARLWNAIATRFHFDIFGALYGVSHPLRRPAAYLATYERLWSESASTPSTIKAAPTT